MTTEVKKLNKEEILDMIYETGFLLTSRFEKAFNSAYEQYRLLEEAELKPPLAYVYISFLRSSVILGKPWFRIDLYGPEGLSDTDTCSAVWDLPFSDAITGGSSERKLSESVIENAESTVEVLGALIPNMIYLVRAQYDQDVKWFFGDYMDLSTEIPLPQNKEKLDQMLSQLPSIVLGDTDK